MDRDADRAWSPELVRARLAAAPQVGLFGRQVHYHPAVSSTNDLCRGLAAAGAPEGTLVLAGEQSAGRGRLARRWYAPPGSALLLSLLFRPALAPARMPRLVMLCSLAAAEAVERLTGLAVGFKWPNDLLIGQAKFGGLLAELGVTGDQLDYVVVGLGLNVNLDPAELAEVHGPITSLSHALGRPVDRLALLVALLARSAERYAELAAGGDPAPAWRARLVTLGRRVRVSAAGETIEGLAVGAGDDGALELRRDDGTLARVHAGDVTLRPEGLV
jgi:BirA family biotin operon repressor/biotin-[acetyl-CoA-carboxylase] ligase